MRSRTLLARFAAFLPAVGVGLALAPHAAAQIPDSAARGAITGTVIEATTGDPLPAAEVTLAPAPAGAFGGRGGGWRESMTARTDSLGRYRFHFVPAGRYTLRVRRLGYHSASVHVDFDATRAYQLSVGLEVAPIVLDAVHVSAPGRMAYAPAARSAPADRRVEIERLRQQRFVPSDARVLTAQDVSEAVTLGESDLFRALQRVPGVTTRDDFTAELWTRGAPWSQTRVYFDGLPLFNPVHAVGAFAGIDPDAIGSAVFQPGVRSVGVGGGASGVIELASRTGGSERLRGGAGLSVVSAHASADRRFAAGRGGWMLAARRSYIDLATAALRALGVDSSHVPYAFTDLAGRADLPIGAGAGIETSVLLERDDVRGSVPSLLNANRGHWGNAAARATLVLPIGSVESRTTVGASWFAARIRTSYDAQGNPLGAVASGASGSAADTGSVPASDSIATPSDSTSAPVDTSTPPSGAGPVPVHTPTDSRVSYVTAESRIAWGSGDGAAAWRAGLSAQRFAESYRGAQASPYPTVPRYDSLTLAARTHVVAAWAERRFALGGLAVELGSRVETGSRVVNGGVMRAAPRVAARYRFDRGQTTVSGAWGRSFQYAQSVAPAGPSIGPELHLMDVWLVAGPAVPAIRADVGAVGVERWLGTSWLGSVTAWARVATGVAVPDPTPGPLSLARPVFVAGTNRARGIELGLRRLAGPWTAGLSFAHARSNIDAGGWTYPSVNDRRDVFDATLSVRVSGTLRLGGVVTVAGGAPFTRSVPDAASCTAGSCTRVTVGAPNAERAPAYRSASLVAEWVARHPSWDLHAYLQLRNVGFGRSAVTYSGTVPCAQARPPYRVDRGTGMCDQFDRGLPLLPLAGIRVEF